MFQTLKLYPDQRINFEQLSAQLVHFGYERTERISQKGEFARRGEIIDIYPINYENPVRIETEFDTIKKSDVAVKIIIPQVKTFFIP